MFHDDRRSGSGFPSIAIILAIAVLLIALVLGTRPVPATRVCFPADPGEFGSEEHRARAKGALLRVDCHFVGPV
jgi:hypothetical protein